jgi:alkylation response protein AidB-like acyl-CoA dehydrogenase
MSTAAIPTRRVTGGSFLLEERDVNDVFTPEDFSEEHLQIAKTAEEFATNEIVPAIDKLEHKEWAVARSLIKTSSDLGLSSVDIPEAYGGADMDKVTSCIIADRIAKYAGFATTWGGHTGIGTLPIVYFGTEEQKKRYLPRLAAGEIVGAYALSESSSGSDALNCRARAELSPDGRHYILNGEKMWITNAGFADLFTVFAKVDGEKFTAFLVEKDFPGFAVGAEEHKMGIRGSSTCPLILTDCKVPVENLLGEIGKGHVIAFNILNVGRFKLGAMCVGGARNSLQSAIEYAKQRKAFGKVIADFGLVREKLADMAVGVFTGESMVYRTIGMIDVALSEIDKSGAGAATEIRKAIEEYAVECSILKVWGSEMVDMVVDETVQIYGGYGFSADYPIERTYRDQRVNRIFEGTNEINRLLITDMLMKRSMKGELGLIPAAQHLMDEILGAPALEETFEDGLLSAEAQLLAGAKKVVLMVAGSALQRYMQTLADEQEIIAVLSNLVMDVYAMESALLRTLKKAGCASAGDCEIEIAATRAFVYAAADSVETEARRALGRIAEGDTLRTQLTVLRRFLRRNPPDTIGLRRRVADRAIELGRYPFSRV